MAKYRAALLLGLMLGLLSACDPVLPEPAVSPTPSMTPAAPTATPTPTATPLPPPTYSPGPVYTLEDFFPLEDVHIRYEEAISNTAVESYVAYFNVEKQVLQRSTKDGKSSPVEVLQLKDGAISRVFSLQNIPYMHNFTDHVSKTSEVLIAEPIRVGNKWPVTGGMREITALEKHMPVPIGSYAALEVTTSMDDGSRQVQYYMKNIGLIAEYAFNPNGVMIRKLEAQSREKGKTQTHNINFYFADPTNSRICVITRQVELAANTNMRNKLAGELRNVPGNSTLIPLSPNVRILSIRPDLKGSVTVDFSLQLVEEMNLGNRGEKLLLQALANTFGDYFDVNRVYITIEGEDYASPNLFLLPGEYLTPDLKQVVRY